MKTARLVSVVVIALLARALAAQAAAPAYDLHLQLDPAASGAAIALHGNMHTVEGAFLAKRGTIHYERATGVASGEIVFDATSGKTGNDSRDKKMHKDVLESARFPEISFRPDHAEGPLVPSGDFTLQVRGLFRIHGTEHEVTFPVQLHLEPGTWTANAAFTVPYKEWGMKNPSVLFLRVGDEVKVTLHAAGSVTP